jgi:hypothetical protein
MDTPPQFNLLKRSAEEPLEDGLPTPKKACKVGTTASAETAELESKVVTRHPGDLYHKDGSIVLVVENVAFKVHQSVLEVHSEVFKNMFGLTTHSVDDLRVYYFDGCPAIHLDDKSEDMVAFLQALYGYP